MEDIMMPSSPLETLAVDLAGSCYSSPSYLQTRARLNHLIDRYISVDILSDRLSDLPSQFVTPHQRHWEPICWQAIHISQIVGVEPELFLSVIAGATEIEMPIRAYSQESWAYMQALHPQMARFMGGLLKDDGSVLEIGIWEKEERQHGPAFSKIYQQLTGQKLQAKPNSVKGYQGTGDAWADLHKHTLSRITTEWSATAIYLWLMAHSTGELQRAIAQPLQDEINHLAKFWGFSRWAFADRFATQLKGTTRNLVSLVQHHQGERTQGQSIVQESLQVEHLAHAIELTFTFTRVMVRLRQWNQELSRSYLKHLFGSTPLLQAHSVAEDGRA